MIGGGLRQIRVDRLIQLREHDGQTGNNRIIFLFADDSPTTCGDGDPFLSTIYSSVSLHPSSLLDILPIIRFNLSIV
jgi:hypothetical protein